MDIPNSIKWGTTRGPPFLTLLSWSLTIQGWCCQANCHWNFFQWWQDWTAAMFSYVKRNHETSFYFIGHHRPEPIRLVPSPLHQPWNFRLTRINSKQFYFNVFFLKKIIWVKTILFCIFKKKKKESELVLPWETVWKGKEIAIGVLIE